MQGELFFLKQDFSNVKKEAFKMKKISFLIILLIVLIALTSCSNEVSDNREQGSSETSIENTEKDDKTKEDSQKDSIDYANERLGFNSGEVGLVAGDGKGNVYFRSELDNWFLYKAKMDGSEKTKICEDVATEINVLDDYIYYANYRDNFNVYRVKTDGTGREKLIDSYCSTLRVTENYMYMGLRDEKNKPLIYRANLDGSNLELLVSGMHLEAYYNGVIYCSDVQNLYSFDLRNSELKKIIEAYTAYVFVDDNGIYFWKPDEGEYCMIDKEGNLSVIQKGGDYYCKYKDRLYYSGSSKDGKNSNCIYYIDLKIGNEVKLYEFSNQSYDFDGNEVELTKQDIRSGNIDEKYMEDNGELNIMNDSSGLTYVVEGALFTRATFRESMVNHGKWDCILKIDSSGYQIFD